MRVRTMAATGLAIGLAAPCVFAEPRLEASGFVGVGWFGDTRLGNSFAPEQVPGTSALVGGRLTWLALPALVGDGAVHLDVGIEGELAIAPAFTGGSSFDDGGRMSYFAPVFAWRAHALVRLAGVPAVIPHLAIGAGGETVASSSPFMAKETDPVVYWGPGASIPVSPGWRVRLDLRHGIMAARAGGLTSTLEIQLGVSATFGLAGATSARRVEPPPPPPVIDERDRDGDGIPDHLDRCPDAAETVNGVEDADGCPEDDPDGDGIIGAADKCPTQAEDFDHFQDEDGCPDPDNDRDGIDDVRDACPNEPETRNGWQDDDGCPDQVPAEVTAQLAAASAIAFEPRRARVTERGKLALAPVLALLEAHREIRIAIIGHPAPDADPDLAKRRVDAVKWDLVDEGVAEDRIEGRVGAAGGPAIEIVLAPASEN